MTQNYLEKFDELSYLLDAIALLDQSGTNQWQRYCFKTDAYAKLSLNKNNAYTYITPVIAYITGILKDVTDETKRELITIQLNIAESAKSTALNTSSTGAEAIQARKDSDDAKVAVDNIVNLQKK